MSPRLEVRAVGEYRSPDYPGLPAPPAFVHSRYAGSVLDKMRQGLARPLVVFGLYASMTLGAAADDDPPVPVPREGREEPGPDGTGVRLLTPLEVSALVCGLDEATGELHAELLGRVRGVMGHLTEEEGRAVLEAFFRKNGIEIARDVRVRAPGLDFTADGFDETSGVGFEFLGPAQPDIREFIPIEADLPPAAVRELELEKARRGRAILVLDGRNYAYNVQYMSSLPTKAQVVERLLEDVRGFFVWLAQEGRLR